MLHSCLLSVQHVRLPPHRHSVGVGKEVDEQHAVAHPEPDHAPNTGGSHLRAPHARTPTVTGDRQTERQRQRESDG